MHPVMGAGHLVGKRLGARGLRVGVGHLEHRRDAAHHRRARARLQVFLVVEAGLAEMHLAVDHAGQEVQAAAIAPLNRRRAREVADGRHPSAADAEIGPMLAIVVHKRAAG